MNRVRAALAASGTDALLLSVGADLPWLIGYRAMPLERLTMLVVTPDQTPKLFVPRLEIARVHLHGDLFEVVGWGETENPVELVADEVPGGGQVAIGNHTWSQFLLGLQSAVPGSTWRPASEVVGPLRAVKDEGEQAALARAGAGVDRVAAALQSGEIPLIGRTEADVSAELGRRILAEGHESVNFAIVAAGENAASPHHHPGARVIQPGEVVLCDFGGTTEEQPGEPGYCSDITRCVYTGEPPEEFAAAYDELHRAQAAAVSAAVVGTPAEVPDRVARDILAEADLEQFFVHRIGHGIGTEEHEDPYLVAGNTQPLVAGNAFSIEPGFYVDGRWGARLEDIVIATDDGPRPVNEANHALCIVES